MCVLSLVWIIPHDVRKLNMKTNKSALCLWIWNHCSENCFVEVETHQCSAMIQQETPGSDYVCSSHHHQCNATVHCSAMLQQTTSGSDSAASCFLVLIIIVGYRHHHHHWFISMVIKIISSKSTADSRTMECFCKMFLIQLQNLEVEGAPAYIASHQLFFGFVFHSHEFWFLN